MSLTQLIYASQPFGFDETVLRGILSDARRCNRRDGITGALICRADIYLQLLEGPGPAVDAAFARIARDNRHLEVQRLYDEPVEERLFPSWAMRDDPARSWMWTERQVADGAAAKATRQELLAIFQRLAETPAPP
jgi:hypothetical protein